MPLVQEATFEARLRALQSKDVMSAQKALQGSETKTRELPEERKKKVFPQQWGHWFAIQTNQWFFNFLAPLIFECLRPLWIWSKNVWQRAYLPWSLWNSRRVVNEYSVPFLNLTLSFLLLLILLSYSGVVVAVCYYHFVQLVLCVNTFFFSFVRCL